jgi:FkbM family methyltransferase
MLLFDIGSNIGSWTLNNYKDNTKIICVEASKNTFKTLVSNTSSKNISCLNYAVTSTLDETVDFFECSTDVLSTLDEDWLKDPKSRFGNKVQYTKTKVPTITIDKLISEYGIPNLLKVDVEGAEDIVLKSLTQKIKIVCFEWAAEWNDKTFNAINHLEFLGYNKFHIQDGDMYTYRPNEYELNKDQLISNLKLKVPKNDWGMVWCS